ncbi:MAG: defense against restriction DarA-related protein [Methylosarcina sp.]
MAVVYELSDGQTITFFFHNPDVTPQKIAPSDELISWKLLLNKRDITIIAAPERGKDINVHEVAQRLMKLAVKNSPAFQRANARRAERMKQIEELKAEIAGLEKELADTQHELEVARVEYEERSMNPPNPEKDYYYFRQNEIQNRFIAIKRALMALGWLQGSDGVSLMDTLSSHAVVYQAKNNTICEMEPGSFIRWATAVPGAQSKSSSTNTRKTMPKRHKSLLTESTRRPSNLYQGSDPFLPPIGFGG